MLFFLEFSLIPTSRSEDPAWTDRKGPGGLPDFIIRKVETCPNPLPGSPFPGNFFLKSSKNEKQNKNSLRAERYMGWCYL